MIFSLKPGDTPCSNSPSQLSPAPCRRSGLRRQATACDEPSSGVKSGKSGCLKTTNRDLEILSWF